MIAVRLNRANLGGKPAEWPVECIEGVATLPEGFDLLLPDAQAYHAHLAQHQAAYDAWEAGRPAPVAVPESVRGWQAKAILRLNGLFEAVETALQELPEPERTVVFSAWEANAALQRHGPTVLAISTALGLTESTVDELFREAAVLEY